MSEIELKPCPFCGAGLDEVAQCSDYPSGEFFVRCYVCNVETRRTATHTEAFEAWNTRPTPEGADVEPNIGAPTAEPSLRNILGAYYTQAFGPDEAKELADKYIAALSLSGKQGEAALPSGDVMSGRRWRHRKRGSTYTTLGYGSVQCSEAGLLDMEHVVIYRADEDGSLWARRAQEFIDGRFEELPAPVSTAPDQSKKDAG